MFIKTLKITEVVKTRKVFDRFPPYVWRIIDDDRTVENVLVSKIIVTFSHIHKRLCSSSREHIFDILIGLHAYYHALLVMQFYLIWMNKEKTSRNSQLRLCMEGSCTFSKIFAAPASYRHFERECTHMVLRILRSLKIPSGKSCRLFSDRNLDHG